MNKNENERAYMKNKVYKIKKVMERIGKYDPVLSVDRGFHSLAYESFTDVLKQIGN